MSAMPSMIIDTTPDERVFSLSEDQFSDIAKVVKDECGIHLPKAKLGLTVTRLQKRITALGLNSFAEYISLVNSKDGKPEIEEMISKITTNVTSFNRESHHFDHFRQNVLPDLMRSASDGESVRLWSAGCSDGREPYTLACLIIEAFPEVHKYDFKILATDIDKYSLAKARSGKYTSDMVASLPPGYAERWFEKSGSDFKVNHQLRSLVQFNLLNLMSPWPMKKEFDAIFCRNVLIYFSTEDQGYILDKFSQHLKKGCHLYLGHSERVVGAATAVYRQVGVTIHLHEPKGRQN